MPNARATLRRYHPSPPPPPARVEPVPVHEAVPVPLSRRDPMATMSAPQRPDLRLLPPEPEPLGAAPPSALRLAAPSEPPSAFDDLDDLFTDVTGEGPEDVEDEGEPEGRIGYPGAGALLLIGLGFALGVVAHGVALASYLLMAGA